MSEAAQIVRFAAPVTKAGLVEDLRALGVASGGVLLVHAAMSRIGWVCGAAPSVVSALLEALGPAGTLVMPAHSMDLTDPAHWVNPPVPEGWHATIRMSLPAFDPETTPTRDMGRIAENFRCWPGVRRSLHPVLSFCAHGPEATRIVATHALEDPFGEASPLAALEALGAQVLMLGTGWDTCTGLHLAERRFWGETPPWHADASPMRIDGRRVWRRYRVPAHDTEGFAAIGAVLDGEGFVRRGRIGAADSRLMALAPALVRAQGLFGTVRGGAS